MSTSPLNQSHYILVNISIPILLHENATYDQYPEHIQVSYTPIDNLPLVSTQPTYELNLADYFGKNMSASTSTEFVHNDSVVDGSMNLSTEESISSISSISPILDLLACVNDKKYLEIVNKTKSKIQKSNTTFRCNKMPEIRRGEFTKKTWKYTCKVNETK